MFDYQTSKHAHFDAACRAFAIEHNLEDVAAAVGMRPQILRNKLNPAQPHRLTCDELLAITDYTEDARLLDGMLGQINCLPSVPVAGIGSALGILGLNGVEAWLRRKGIDFLGKGGSK